MSTAMSTDDEARDAFLTAARRIYAGVDASTLRTIDDPALAVPGFTTFEVQAQVPVRGWARGELAVLARFQNFGPVLDALAFRDDAVWSSPDALVARLVWLHGPPYRQVDHLDEGELGAPDELDLAPRLDHDEHGVAALRFALLDPGGSAGGGGEPASVFQYRIVSLPSGEYRIDTTQVAPADPE
jgi:hypothetical protein